MLNQQERPTMTVKEAAEYIGVSLPSVYNWTERADCNFLIRVGRRKLILKSRFMEFLEKQTEQNGR